jgi:hypothetical protein
VNERLVLTLSACNATLPQDTHIYTHSHSVFRSTPNCELSTKDGGKRGKVCDKGTLEEGHRSKNVMRRREKGGGRGDGFSSLLSSA